MESLIKHEVEKLNVQLQHERINKRRDIKYYTLKENFELSLLALPAVILLFIFNYMPMIGSIVAFKRFRPNLGIFGSGWVGFKNFEFFFTSQDAWRVARNTVLYSFDFMIVNLVGAVLIAILLYNIRNKIAVKAYNTVMILPKFLSMVLIAFIVYAVLNPTAGVMNQILHLFGFNGTINWYAEPKWWPLILTITNLWMGIGMNSIIYYAALVGMDTALLEAAQIDGATKWQQTRYVSIPHIVPIMTITTILAFGSIFSGDFGLFYQTTMDVGLLYPTTDIINTYVFRGLQNGNLEISAAVGLFQSVVGLIMILIVNGIVRKISPENSMF